ncbi:MAG TPA: hypothetical protein VFX54_06150, partial [Candidatus Binatia bacterium]|nr:hypothetical protein [Candidatus Binatia bacterium]
SRARPLMELRIHDLVARRLGNVNCQPVSPAAEDPLGALLENGHLAISEIRRRRQGFERGDRAPELCIYGRCKRARALGSATLKRHPFFTSQPNDHSDREDDHGCQGTKHQKK